MDPAERDLLAETLRKTMTAASGRVLDLALVELGWPDLLAEFPDVAIPMAFGLLGETGAHAPLLNDVLLTRRGTAPAAPCRCRTRAARGWCGSAATWPADDAPAAAPARRPGREPVALAAGRRRSAGGWPDGRAMLALARSHALDRIQFGRPLASFQAVRHRLAETSSPRRRRGDPAGRRRGEDVSSMLLAKAAAGHAALTAARHCQQVLAGSGSPPNTAAPAHPARPVLDGLLGSAGELPVRRALCERKAPPRDSFICEGLPCRYSGQNKAGITCLRMKMTIPGCQGATRPER